MSSAPKKRPRVERDDDDEPDEPIAMAHGLTRVTLRKEKRDKGTRVFLKGDRAGELLQLFKSCIVTPTNKTKNVCYYAATNSREQMDKICAFLKRDLERKEVVDFQPYGIELHTAMMPSMRPHPTAPDTVIVEPGELTSRDQYRNQMIWEMDKIYRDNLKSLAECDNVFRRGELVDLMYHLEKRRRHYIARWQSAA